MEVFQKKRKREKRKIVNACVLPAPSQKKKKIENCHSYTWFFLGGGLFLRQGFSV
jgi:hypothetical protein